MLGVPSGCACRLTHRTPPVDLLIQHDTAAFIGASNDELAAALAIAFVERGHRQWQELTVWFLDDDRLDQLGSDGRSGASLRRASHRAQGELLRLLPIVAMRWRVARYGGLQLAGTWQVASLWDWQQPGGLVRVSPGREGEEAGTTGDLEVTWPGGSLAPSPAYRAVVQAYEALGPLPGRSSIGPG
jgi:hypothetical protein